MQKYRVFTPEGFVEFADVAEAQAFCDANVNNFAATMEPIVEVPPPVNYNVIVKAKILAAMDFGKNLMAEYGAQNVLSGKSNDQIKAISDKLAAVQTLLLSGSLYVTLDEMSKIVPDANVTQETIDYFTSRIKEYLGIT